MKNIITLVVRALRIISCMVIISIFLNLHESWSDSGQVLQDVRRSIFAIKIGKKWIGDGFMIEKDTLVTNFHLYKHLMGKYDLSSIIIKNINGKKFRIEGVRGIHLLGNLTLLKIKDYKGSHLVLGGSTEVDLSNKSESIRLSEIQDYEESQFVLDKSESIIGFCIVGFLPSGILIKRDLIKDRSNSDSLNQQFFKIYGGKHSRFIGSPIVNDMGEVEAVAKYGDFNRILGIKKEILQDFLNETRNQEIVSDEKTIQDWIKQEFDNLETLAKQGDVHAQIRLGWESSWIHIDDQDHKEAQYRKGAIFFFEGDTEQAKIWWKEASLQGHSEAQSKLGLIFFNEGDMQQAKHWWTLAADRGHVIAQYRLGGIFLNDRDMGQAKIWLKRAAEQGYLNAYSKMFLIFNFEKNYEQAKIWWERNLKNEYFNSKFKHKPTKFSKFLLNGLVGFLLDKTSNSNKTSRFPTFDKKDYREF